MNMDLRHSFSAALVGLFAILIAVVAPHPALAGVINTFNVSGTFDNGSTLGGAFTLDVTTGDATAVDLTVDSISIASLVNTIPGYPVPSETTLAAVSGGSGADYANLSLIFPVANLIGYNGGALSTSTRVDLSLQSPYLTSGTASAVPLPPTLLLFATGLGALGLLGWFRKRKKAAAVAAV